MLPVGPPPLSRASVNRERVSPEARAIVEEEGIIILLDYRALQAIWIAAKSP